MKQNTNRINGRMLLVLTVLSVFYVIYYVNMRNLMHLEPFAVIFVGKNGMYMDWEGFEWGMNSSLVIFFAVESVVFLVYRLWQIRRVDGKGGEELLEAYPYGRRQRIIEDIAGSVAYLLYMSVITFAALMLLEGIAAYRLEKMAAFEQLRHHLVNGNLCAAFWIGFLCLLFLVLLELLCEVVMTNRSIAWMTGAVILILYHAIQMPDQFLVADLITEFWPDQTLSFGGVDYPPLMTIGIAAGLLLAGALLLTACVRLYQKRELSTNGLFYFPLAKDVFLCLCWLPVLWFGGFFDRPAELTLSGRVGIMIGVVCGVVVLNYLVCAQQIRKNAKRFCMSVLRPVLLLAAAGALLLCVRDGSDEEQAAYEETYDDLVYSYTEENADELLKTQEARSAYYETVREKIAGVELPDVEGEWGKCHFELSYSETPERKLYAGYSMGHVDDGQQIISYSMRRCYGDDDALVEVDVISGTDLNALRFVEDEKLGTIYCTSWVNHNRVTICKYQEQEGVWDIYSVWGDRSYEELIEELRTFH